MTEEFKEQFSVDSALLKELGEHLVGAPHIALAELIKNSYDADANRVEINFGLDRIEVSDNGLGMDLDEFRTRWMRVGSPHKAIEAKSQELGRPLTGSKGVGRLAAQFLGSRIELQTTSIRNPGEQLVARIDWEQAVSAGELTNATAQFRMRSLSTTYPSDAASGSTITIEGLRQLWAPADFEKLAREIWFLRPPFANGFGRQVNTESSFEVRLSADRPAQEAFETQLRRVLDLWMARIRGRLETTGGRSQRSTVKILIEFQGGGTVHESYELPLSIEESRRVLKETGIDLGPESFIDGCQFEIRIFDLRNKQKFGIKVGEARAYLAEHGGVHVYDGGFRIPFSGPEADWLGLEIAHSHRLATTRLLPADLRVRSAATYLPTNSRVFGAVYIDTSGERRAVACSTRKLDRNGYSDHLQIQVSRDRLVRNRAFLQLRYVILRALQHYATEQARRKLAEIERRRDVTSPSDSARSVLEILASHRADIPTKVYGDLNTAIGIAVQNARLQTQLHQDLASQLATFASAGSLALVYDHEVSRQISRVERIVSKLRGIETTAQYSNDLANIASEFDEWVSRAKGIRYLVRHLSEPDLRTASARYKLSAVLADAIEGARILTRGIPINYSEIPRNVRLPRGLYSGWIALFQNLFVNAANAIIAKGDAGQIGVELVRSEGLIKVRVQDTGIGADLGEAESYFDPFVRKLEIPAARRALAAGGTGLGLTIVRMIANDANVDVRFTKPDPPFATAIEIQWIESA